MRIAISFLVFPLVFPVLAYSDCWEMIPRNGETIVAKDIWGLRDRLGGGSAILGRFENKDVTMPVENIQSIEFDGPKKGWLGILQKSEARGTMTLTSGKLGQFTTSHAIRYIRDTEQEEISTELLKSVKRCTQQTVEQETANSATKEQSAASVVMSGGEGNGQVIMKNGDILIGVIVTTEFHWKSEYELLKIPEETIQSIEIQEGENMTGVLHLRSGGRIAGVLENSEVKIHLPFGQDISVPAGKVREIRFNAR